MGLKAKEATSTILDTIANALDTFEQAERDLQYHSDACTDLEHVIELLPDHHPQRRGIDVRLMEARRKRRRAKETLEQYDKVIVVLRRYKNLSKELSQALQGVNVTLGKQNKRKYRMRVLTEFGESLDYRVRDEISSPRVTTFRRRVSCNLM